MTPGELVATTSLLAMALEWTVRICGLNTNGHNDPVLRRGSLRFKEARS